MSNDIINELLTIESFATGLAQRAARLRKKLQPVSTGRSKKNEEGLSADQKVKLISKREKVLLKSK